MNCECHPKPQGTNPDCPVHGLSHKAEERRVELSLRKVTETELLDGVPASSVHW